MNEFLKAEDLTFSYPDEESGIPAVSGVNLTIQKGEYVAILGHNGSGKSTLAKLFNLILLPTGGSVTVDGISFFADEETDDAALEEKVYSVRRRVGMVFQNPDNQLVASIVEEDVAFGPENLGLPSETIRERVDSALDAVDMRDYARRTPHSLSGGQKQRVAIAGVLAMKPACMIFDESTAMLDPRGRREVLAVMESLNREGITVLHITHYMEEAARADRVIVMNDGRMLMDGTPREVFSRVEELKEIGLEVPQGTELLFRLRAAGFDFPLGVTDFREAADMIAALYREVRDE